MDRISDSTLAWHFILHLNVLESTKTTKLKSKQNKKSVKFALKAGLVKASVPLSLLGKIVVRMGPENK